MLCPEGTQFQNETPIKDEEDLTLKKKQKVPDEGTGSYDLRSFPNPKSWKKSITNFFRNQLRSTKSNDGDNPSGSKDHSEEKDVTVEKKWQSLGKIFRRQCVVDHKLKSVQRDDTSQSKRLAVRKVLSSYFGKVKPSDEH